MKRYDIETEDSGISTVEVETEDGEWIKYSDFEEFIDKLLVLIGE